MTVDPLNEAVEAVADRLDVDWEALDRESSSVEGRDELKWLRVIAEIADHHREARQFVDANANTVTAHPAAGLAAPAPEPLGDTWGRYQLLEQIGQGSYGSVHRAFDPDLQLEIAIKILHRQVADEKLRERVLHEGRALARIRHDNVVRVLGVESHGGRVGLCMEFVPGETLDAVMRANGLRNDREAAVIGQDLCRALVAVHNAGFLHRDVKARNVMRRRDGGIVLMDFGAGFKLERDQAAAGFDVVGTPRYMAPEVLAGDAPSRSSDVYSVGVLLYHLVTGEYPVDGGSMDDLLRNHVAGRRRPLSDRRADLPPAFIKVVSQATHADPRQRFQSAGALLDALQYDAKRSRLRIIGESVGLILAIAVGWSVLGAMSSVVFNSALGRTEFNDEGLFDWLRWGARSTLMPTVLLIMGLVLVTLVLAARRIVLRLSSWARTIDAEIGTLVRARGLDDLTLLSSVALLVSSLALGTTVWWFSPLLAAIPQVFPSISTASVEHLRFLSPDHFTTHENYRFTLTLVTIACVALWYPVWRVARRKDERLNMGLVAGGVAITVLSVLFLNFPYRLLWHTQFETVTWSGQRCYLLGSRADADLLFCPEMPPPRNKVVESGAANVGRTGTVERIFSHLPN